MNFLIGMNTLEELFSEFPEYMAKAEIRPEVTDTCKCGLVLQADGRIVVFNQGRAIKSFYEKHPELEGKEYIVNEKHLS